MGVGVAHFSRNGKFAAACDDNWMAHFKGFGVHVSADGRAEKNGVSVASREGVGLPFLDISQFERDGVVVAQHYIWVAGDLVVVLVAVTRSCGHGVDFLCVGRSTT